MKINSYVTLIIFVICTSCSDRNSDKLPIIGNYEIIGSDTTFHQISTFNFLNQDSNLISNKTLSDNIYVADFFYSYCPTICPKVKNQMIRIHDKYEGEEDLKLISFALDPIRDNVEHLKAYSQNLGINKDKWYLLTGEKDEIWDLAEDFLISVREDPDEPGGIFHSGKIILIDKEGHIRAFADGTQKEEVNKFMKSIERLLDE